MALKPNANSFAASTWVLSIGVSDYESPQFPKLRSAAQSARDLAQALQSPDGCAIPQSNIATLVDVTAEEMRSGLRTAALRVPPGGILIIFFAGHGHREAEEFFLCGRRAAQEQLALSGVSGSELDALLSQTQARGVLLLLDCCRGANAAELAPRLFRIDTGSDFRILVSASRGEGKSWEFEEGTLFTKYLLHAVKGTEQLGTRKGEIYFSELLEYVQSRISEELEVRQPGVTQEPVFIGTYPRDPLLFLHREMTLQRVALQTARYSPSYVRRMVRRSVGGLLAVVFFVLGTWYSLLDAWQYADAQGGRLTLYRGHPRLNAFGFPKQFWSVTFNNYGEAILRQSGPVVAPLGHPVVDWLPRALRPVDRALLYSWQEKASLQREAILEVFARAANPGEQNQEITGADVDMLAEVGEPEDLELFRKLLNAERDDVRTSALVGILRLSPVEALARARDISPEMDHGAHDRILQSLKGPCTSEVRQYLAWLLSTPVDGDDLPVVGAVLRLQCELTAQELVAGVRAFRAFGVPSSTGRLGELMAPEAFGAELARQLQETRSVREDWGKRVRLLLAYAELNKAPCLSLLGQLMQSDKEELFVRRYAAQAYLAHCSQSVDSLPEVLREDPYVVAAMWRLRIGEAHVYLRAGLKKAKAIDEYERIISAIAERPDADGLKLLMELNADPLSGLHERDRPHVRFMLAKLFADTCAPVSFPVAYARGSNLDLRKNAYKLLLCRREPKLVQELLGKLSDAAEADYAVEFIIKAGPDSAVLEQMNERLGGMVVERKSAAMVLAACAPSERVVELLLHPDEAIRDGAMAYVEANPAFERIVETVNARQSILDAHHTLLRRMKEHRTIVSREIQATPERFRPWRKSVVIKTSALSSYGFQMWLSMQ